MSRRPPRPFTFDGVPAALAKSSPEETHRPKQRSLVPFFSNEELDVKTDWSCSAAPEEDRHEGMDDFQIEDSGRSTFSR